MIAGRGLAIRVGVGVGVKVGWRRAPYAQKKVCVGGQLTTWCGRMMGEERVRAGRTTR